MEEHASKLNVQEIERREPEFQNSPCVLMALTPALQRLRHYDLQVWRPGLHETLSQKKKKKKENIKAKHCSCVP